MRKIEGSASEGGFRVINTDTDTVEFESKSIAKCLERLWHKTYGKKPTDSYGRKSKNRRTY